MPEISVGACPLVPYSHPVVLEVLHIGVTFQEPQQLMDYGFQMEFFGGEEGESVAEVKAHLMAEHTACACACAVAAVNSLGHDPVQ